MKVFVLMRHYEEDYCHPFNDPEQITELKGVYASREDVDKAKERADERAKQPGRARMRERFSVIETEVLGLFPQDTAILRRITDQEALKRELLTGQS